MALLAQLYGSGRAAERHAIETDATLRHDDRVPVDVLVANLSKTGCLFVCAEPLPLDREITLGIAGLGRRAAKIVRALDQRYGCEFLIPLTEADVVTASTTPTNTIVHFPNWPITAGTEADWPHVDKLPKPIRLAILVGATAAFWSLGIALIAWLR